MGVKSIERIVNHLDYIYTYIHHIVVYYLTHTYSNVLNVEF